MFGPLLFLLLFQSSPVPPPPAVAKGTSLDVAAASLVWGEEAHREAQKLPPGSRVYALQRLSVWAWKAAPAQAAAYFREAFQAAGDVEEANRRGRIQYQLVRDLAESAPNVALSLALEMGESLTSEADWRLAAASVALDTWIKRDPVQAAEALEGLYSAGILNLNPATHLVDAVRTTHPDLAEQVFQRSLTVYQSIAQRDLSMMAELILQSQAMLSVNRESALKTLHVLVDDTGELAKSGRAEAPAAPGLRAMVLDTLRQADPEEAAKLALKDSETAALLKDLPAGFSTPTNQTIADPAPGIDRPTPQSYSAPQVDPEEQREVVQAVRGLIQHEKEWSPERVSELAYQVKAPSSRANLLTVLAVYGLVAGVRETESHLQRALGALAELYDSEPFDLPASQRSSTILYSQLIAELARRNAERALRLAKDLPGPDTRFEVLLYTAERLLEQRPGAGGNKNGGSG